MPPLNSYSLLQYFTIKMHEALLRLGVQSRLLEAKNKNPAPFLKVLFEDSPDCTLSFNGLLPDEQGRFFSDMIKIPHVAFIVDSPLKFLPLIKSKNTIITCVDRSSVNFFNGMGFPHALFMPHAADKELTFDPAAKRDYDVVMLASCIDYEAIRASWKGVFSPSLIKAMEETAEMTLHDSSKPYYEFFSEAVDKQISLGSNLDKKDIDFIAVLEQIELYIKGKERVEILKSITSCQVDLFGSSLSQIGWNKYLGGHSHIKIHDPVPFDQALNLMKHSKIILNSSSLINYGANERIFSGLACGALVITSENAFLKEQFVDGESLVFYQHGKWDKLNHRIHEYLAQDKKRESVVKKGLSIVKKSHTWDVRAHKLINELPAILLLAQNENLDGAKASGLNRS